MSPHEDFQLAIAIDKIAGIDEQRDAPEPRIGAEGNWTITCRGPVIAGRSVAVRFIRIGVYCHENSFASNRSLDPIRWLVHNNAVLLRPSADMARSEPDLHINSNRRNSRRIATPTRERPCPDLVGDIARSNYATMLIHPGADLYRRLLRWDSVLLQRTWHSFVDARVGAPVSATSNIRENRRETMALPSRRSCDRTKP